MYIPFNFPTLPTATGEEYVEFSRFWHESLPENAMAFPAIFGIVKQRSHSRFPRLAEDYWW